MNEDLHRFVSEHAEEGARHSLDYLRLVAYWTAHINDVDNFAVRKVLHYEGVPIREVHDLIAEAMSTGMPLRGVVAGRRPEISARIEQVGLLLTDAQNDPERAAAELAELLDLHDRDALARELVESPIGLAAADREDEEAVETAGAVGSVALLTMIGSKGLSAHHVIIVGCDDINMGRTSQLTFFVAVTRARKSLHLVVARKATGAKVPNDYVYDLPEEFCDHSAYRTSNNPPLERLASRRDFRRLFERWHMEPASAEASADREGPRRCRVVIRFVIATMTNHLDELHPARPNVAQTPW